MPLFSSSGLYDHEIIDVVILTTAQLSIQTVHTVILLKVSNDLLIPKSDFLFLISNLLKVSASPEEASSHYKKETWVYEW